MALVGLWLFQAPGCSWLGKHLADTERARLSTELEYAARHATSARIDIIRRSETGTLVLEIRVPRGAAFDAVLGAVRAKLAERALEVKTREVASHGGRLARLECRRNGQLLHILEVRERITPWRIAIIIDDLGSDLAPLERLLSLNVPVTFSVLPQLAHSRQTASRIHARGHEVMLHLPMEADPGAPVAAGPGAIEVGMSSRQIERILQQDLATVPFAVGVNNHMGSRASADSRLMRAFMAALAQHRLYFVDSRTSPQTVALMAAQEHGLAASFRSVFLDDVESVPYTLGQLRQLARRVRQQGTAIAIGHPHPTTIAALEQFLPQLAREGMELVYASQIVCTEAGFPSP